jgi:hypothetical protein
MVCYTTQFLLKNKKIKLTHYHFSNTNHNIAEYNLSVHLSYFNLSINLNKSHTTEKMFQVHYLAEILKSVIIKE